MVCWGFHTCVNNKNKRKAMKISVKEIKKINVHEVRTISFKEIRKINLAGGDIVIKRI